MGEVSRCSLLLWYSSSYVAHSLYNSQHVFSADSDSYFSVLLFPPLFSLLPTAFSLRKQVLQPQSRTRVHKDNDLLLRVSHMPTYTHTPITSYDHYIIRPLHHTTITSYDHYTVHAAQCSYCTYVRTYTQYRHSYSSRHRHGRLATTVHLCIACFPHTL